MTDPVPFPPASAWLWPGRLFGGLLAMALLFGLGEAYLRQFPPSSLCPFLGPASPLTGPLSPDPDFRVGFASWEALQADNPQTLGPGSPLGASTADPVWLFLGSSFAYELTTVLRQEAPGQPVTNLDRRELLIVRLAQVKRLLESGRRPARIVLVTIAPDFLYLGAHQLAHHHAGPRGGLVVEPRLPPGPLGPVVRHSRLALSGWVRLGRHKDLPAFGSNQLATRVPDSLRQDLEALFAGLGRLQEAHAVPITVLHIPPAREVTRQRRFALDDALAAVVRARGLAYLDVRPAFLAHPRPAALYVPDGHLSRDGNLLVLRELLRPARERDLVAHLPGPRP